MTMGENLPVRGAGGATQFLQQREGRLGVSERAAARSRAQLETLTADGENGLRTHLRVQRPDWTV